MFTSLKPFIIKSNVLINSI